MRNIQLSSDASHPCHCTSILRADPGALRKKIASSSFRVAIHVLSVRVAIQNLPMYLSCIINFLRLVTNAYLPWDAIIPESRQKKHSWGKCESPSCALRGTKTLNWIEQPMVNPFPLLHAQEFAQIQANIILAHLKMEMGSCRPPRVP